MDESLCSSSLSSLDPAKAWVNSNQQETQIKHTASAAVSSTQVERHACFTLAKLSHGNSPLTLSCNERQGTGYDPKADVRFHDPMVDPMPNAPSLKMFNIYGVGKATERCVAWPASPQRNLLKARCTEFS